MRPAGWARFRMAGEVECNPSLSPSSLLPGLLLGRLCRNSGPKETGGAVIGGVAGGLLGNTIGHGNGRAAATILGAALGAVVGGAVGRSLDDADRERAYYAANGPSRRAARPPGTIRAPAIAAASCRADPIAMTMSACAAISSTRSGSTASPSSSKARLAKWPTAAGASSADYFSPKRSTSLAILSCWRTVTSPSAAATRLTI